MEFRRFPLARALGQLIAGTRDQLRDPEKLAVRPFQKPPLAFRNGRCSREFQEESRRETEVHKAAGRPKPKQVRSGCLVILLRRGA